VVWGAGVVTIVAVPLQVPVVWVTATLKLLLVPLLTYAV